MTEAAVATLGTMAALHLRAGSERRPSPGPSTSNSNSNSISNSNGLLNGNGHGNVVGSSGANSRRDRKRQHLIERLSTMTEKFSRDRDATYRDQLRKVQVDTDLVLRFDPYAADVLDKIAELRREHSASAAGTASVVTENARSLLEMSGPTFHEFLQEIEDLIEIRDFQLTEHKIEYERKLHEYNMAHTCRVETAKRENKALVSTLRDRLINTISSEKGRLNKEKEALEISDSSALLLHPNLFSITNPGSPGGPHGKRTTRLRKETEELPADGSRKRKRNLGDEEGSPVPMRRALDVSNTTPLWQSERLRVAAKQNGPVYHIDKLFTDKELTMAYNAAALAAYRFMLKNGVLSPSPDDSDSGNDRHDDHGDQDGTESSPSVVPMVEKQERQVAHMTRSSHGLSGDAGGHGNNNGSGNGCGASGNGGSSSKDGGVRTGHGPSFVDDKIVGIEAITNLESGANLDLFYSRETPKMPPLVPQAYLKPYPRSGDPSVVNGLGADDVAADLLAIDMFKQYDAARRPGSCLDSSTPLRKMLEAVAFPSCESKYAGFMSVPRDDSDSLRRTLGLPPAAKAATSNIRGVGSEHASPATPRAVPVLAGGSGVVPMSRQSSLGGGAMSRQGTGGSTRGSKGVASVRGS